jgi:hypothetical protein
MTISTSPEITEGGLLHDFFPSAMAGSKELRLSLVYSLLGLTWTGGA